MPIPGSVPLRRHMGIDPGQSGGIAIVGNATCPAAHPMPKTDKDTLDLFKLAWLWPQGAYGGVVALIEKVHAMPGNGVSSMFKFGVGYGKLLMALTAAKIPFEEVQPRAWQKGLGIAARGKTESHTEFKNRLKQKAQQLFPDVKVTLATADALLIAEFCRRTKK